ncbi:unnamed protein product [Dibothriocephalus latus]|uniref:Saposin B-type domain-containing protein n=1 Tax=Dibothriocephalus latus TaxID=60516 RepID=A0A3P7P3G4_DIBLA|nr:unnamed protein product [Dibothriocephalus latus]
MLKNLVKEKLCASFGIFEKMCEAAVSKQVDAMIDDASNTNITELCVLFEQCAGVLSVELQAFMQAVLEKQVSQSRSPQPLTPLLGAKENQKPGAEIPVVCEFCETLIKKVLDLTVNNLTEEAVISALEQPLPLRLGDTCELCQMVIQYVYNQISDNATEAEIEEHLKHVCDHVGPLKDQTSKTAEERSVGKFANLAPSYRRLGDIKPLIASVHLLDLPNLQPSVIASL